LPAVLLAVDQVQEVIKEQKKNVAKFLQLFRGGLFTPIFFNCYPRHFD
jgi:hypothetical protein